ATQRNIEWLKHAGVHVMLPDEGEMACGEYGRGRLPEPEAVWLEIAELLSLDPGEVGAGEIAGYLEALEPEDEPEHKGGLAGILSSIIPRSTPRRIQEDEVTYDEDTLGELSHVTEEELPVPDLAAAGPIIATKGKDKAAPPTDREAINHEVNR